MLKKRLIACLLIRNGHLIKTRNFYDSQIIGNPITSIQLFNAWAIDEIIVLDLSRDNKYDFERRDLKHENPSSLPGIISYISKSCFVPLTVGGGIRTIEDIEVRLRSGADKITINKQVVEYPEFISESSGIFGSQCIVVSIDVKINPSGKYEVYTDYGTKATGLDPSNWAREAQEKGAGEILLNSIDRDGTMMGYDTELVRSVSEAVSIPVVACGGAGQWQDFVDVINLGKASAACAANIFHFREQSTRMAKKHMKNAGIDVRYNESFVPLLKIHS